MPRKSYKFTARKKTAYIEAISKGFRRGAAAQKVGVTRKTVALAVLADSDFAQAVDDAEISVNEVVEDALYGQCKKGNLTAIQVWLYNRWPERWRDMRNLNKPSDLEQLLERLPVNHADAIRRLLADPPRSERDSPAVLAGPAEGLL